MGKTVWISCKQVVEYKQQHTISDEEYDILMNEIEEECGCIVEPNTSIRNSAYSIMEGYINANDIMDCEREYTDVEIEVEKKKPNKKK